MTLYEMTHYELSRDLQFAAKCRSLALLGMTKPYEYLEAATPGILPVILNSAPSGKILY